jgi:hypothetical protein
VPYGFAPGTIYGKSAKLWQPRNLLNISDPEIDYFTAVSTDACELFVIMISEAVDDKTVSLQLSPRELEPFKRATWGKSSDLAGSSKKTGDNSWSVDIAGNGIAVLRIGTTLHDDPLGPAFRNFTLSGNVTSPTVAWSFWIVVESWAEWSLPSAEWTSLTASTNYTFSATLDLGAVDAEYVMVRIASKDGDVTGHSDPVKWSL